MSKDHRVRRPKQYDGLMNLLKDEGLFDSLKSVLVFAAAVGANQGVSAEFSDSAEKIPLRIFSEAQDLPFMYALALSETGDVSMLAEENMEQVLSIFENTAAAGLSYLNGVIDQARPKESLEQLVSSSSEQNLIDDLTNIW